MKSRRLQVLLPLMVLLLWQTVGFAQSTPPVRYKLDRDASGTYRVFMTSTQSFTGVDATIATAQVTLRVPTGTFPNLKTSTITSYSGTGYSTQPDGTTIATATISDWRRGTRVNKPTENPAYDYLSFNFQQSDYSQTFDIPANVDILLFSFSDGGSCPGPVSLLVATDPFNPVGGTPNSANTNPGNQISIFGFGTGAFAGILGGATTCPALDLAVSVGPVPLLFAGQSASLPISVSNVSGTAATGPITVTSTLPTNYSAAATFVSNTFSCTTVGQQITCVDANTATMPAGAVKTLALPITPSSAAVGTLPTFSGTVSSTNTEPITTNNTGSATATNVVQGTPSLLVGVGPVPTLIAGQSTSIPVSVSNVGSGPTTGPITVALTLPTNTTAPALFSDGPWSCTTTGQSVVCVNPTALPSGGVSAVGIPVTAAPALIGTTPVFSVTTTNASTTIGSSVQPTQPVQGAPDLTTSVGPVPPLAVGQLAQLPVTITNVGAGPATGPITFSTTLPTSVSAPALFSSGAFSCTTVGQAVQCVNPNTTALTAGSSTTFVIPITPLANSAGQTPTFTGTTQPVPGESTTANNTAPQVSPTQPIQSVGVPDLTTTIGQPVPAPMIAGQPSQVPVLISNVGTGPAIGPIICEFPVATNLSTSPSSFTSNGFTCVPGTQSLTCTNPNPTGLGSGSSVSLTFPVTANTAAVGTTPTFSGTTQPVAGEANVANNVTITVATQAVQLPSSSTGCTVSDCGTGVRYGLKLAADGVTYTVYMKSATAYSGNDALIATAQVTLVLPTGTQITSLTNLQTNVNFAANVRVNTPSENPSSDYLSIGYNASTASGSTLFDITSNVEYALFSFRQAGPCAGKIGLFDNTTDPFKTPNSKNTNPGNQMTISANGASNAYTCNYTCPITCAQPALTVVLQAPTGTLNQGVPFDYTVTAGNVGNGATAGPIVFTNVLPAGLQYVSGGSNGWTCAATGQTISCTYTASIGAGSSSNFTIRVNSTVSGTLSTSGTVTGGGQTILTPSQPCLICSQGPTTVTIAPSQSDLIVGIQQPTGALSVGQSSTLSVSVSNGLAGLASGPLSVSVTITGSTLPASFTTNEFACVATGTVAVCTNPASLSGGQSVSLQIPFTPSASSINQTLLFAANVALASNETNGNNNFIFVFANTTVVGPDLSVTVGPAPTLTLGQTAQLPILIQNIGQGLATGPLTVTVTLPANVSLGSALPGGGFTVIGSTLNSNGTTSVILTNPNTVGLSSGSTLSLTVPVVPNAGVATQVSFSSLLSLAPGETNGLNNLSSLIVSVNMPDLQLTAGSPNPGFTTGQTSIVSLTVTNVGSAAATGPFSITTTLPAGFSLNSALLAGWSLQSSVTNGNGSTTLVFMNTTTTLAPGQTIVLNLPVIAGAPGQSGSIVVTVGSASSELTLVNNTVNLLVSSVSPSIQIVVQGPTSFTVTQPVGVTIILSNTGNANYTGPVTTQITLPAGVTLGTLPVGWIIQSQTTGPNGVIIYTLYNPNVTIPVGGNVLFVVPITPSITLLGQVISITITTPTYPGYNTPVSITIITTPVVQLLAPNVVVTIGSPSPTFSVGQPSVIQVTFTNTGNASANGPFTTQITLPAGLSINATLLPAGWIISSTTAGPNGSTIYVLINSTTGPISSGGGTLILNVPITVYQPVAGTTPSITITIQPANQPTPGTNTLIVIQPVTAPNLVLVVGQPSPNLVVNQTSVIPVYIYNTGNGTAFGPITTQITLPAGVSLGTLPAGVTLIGSVAGANGTTIITLSVSNTSGLTAGNNIIINVPVIPANSVVGTSPSFVITLLPVQGQNTSQTQTIIVNVPVQSGGAPDLVIVGSQPNPAFVAGQTSLIALTITNNGTTGYTGVVSVQFAVPSGFGVNSAQLPAGWYISSSVAGANGSTIYTFTHNSQTLVALGGNITFNVPLTPGTANIGQTFVLGIVVNAVTGESNTANNSNTITITIPVRAATAPDLVIVGGQPNPAFIAGQTSLIALTVTNNGTASYTGPVSVQMAVPSGFSINASLLASWSISGSVAGSNGSTIYTFTNANVTLGAAGGNVTLNVPLVPSSANVGYTYVLGIAVNAVTNESNTSNNGNSITISTAVLPATSPDLTISALTPSPNFVVGQTSLMAVTVTNVGSAVANAPLSIQIALAAGLSMPAGQLPAGYTISNQVVNSSGGYTYTITGSAVSLAVGGAVTINVPITPSATNLGQTFVFGLLVVPASGEINVSNNTTQVSTSVAVQPAPAPDLTVILPNQSFSLTAGQTSNITFTVANIGNASSGGSVTVTFGMPTSFTTNPSVFTTGGFSCTTTGSSARCVSSFSMSSGGLASLTIPAQPTVAGLVNPTFQIVVAAAVGETVLFNNIGAINYIGVVQSGGFSVAVKAILQGPFNPTTGLMRDDLRRQNRIPTLQPYGTTLGSPAFVLINSGTETVSQSVLSGTGNNAIVDWVLVELRSASNPAALVATKPALIQADGDVVSSTDGVSAIPFTGLSAGQYYVSIRHRNHLGVMSAFPVTLSNGLLTFDFTNPAGVYRSSLVTNYPQYVTKQNQGQLWAGNTTGDNNVIFQGVSTDADPVFFITLGDSGNIGRIVNYIHSGYDVTDINLDGVSVFQGPSNELDTIFFNVINHPENSNRLANFIIHQQLP